MEKWLESMENLWKTYPFPTISGTSRRGPPESPRNQQEILIQPAKHRKKRVQVAPNDTSKHWMRGYVYVLS